MARTPVGTSGWVTRRERVRARLAETDAGAFLVLSLTNIRYLSGFTGSAGMLVIAAEPPDVLVTDFRYRTQSSEEVGDGIEVEVVNELAESVREYLVDRGLGSVAFESEHMSVATREEWREVNELRLAGVSGWVEELRVVKEPAEVRSIERAARMADRAFDEILPEIRPGLRERELAAEIDYRLVHLGSERPAFETIVAFGARTALPHARPGDHALADGELVLIDFGASVDGYHSDMTRTISCGEPSSRMRRVYELVVRAQTAALDGLRAGLEGRVADALARDVIEDAGYGETFGHSLGHGIGLEVHERPRLSRTSEESLPAGAVVTVEPGIYIPSEGGVRVEDDVVLTPRGARALTRAPKQSFIVL